MNSKTYVSDPKIWEVFYQNMAEKTFNPYKYRPKQKGRGWTYKQSYRIPIRPHSEINVQPSVPLVTPVAAVEERVKDEYKKDVQEGNPHVTPDRGIKRQILSPNHIPQKKRKEAASQKVKGKRSKQKFLKTNKKNLESVSKKTVKKLTNLSKKKRNKKDLKIDQHRSIFK